MGHIEIAMLVIYGLSVSICGGKVLLRFWGKGEDATLKADTTHELLVLVLFPVVNTLLAYFILFDEVKFREF